MHTNTGLHKITLLLQKKIELYHHVSLRTSMITSPSSSLFVRHHHLFAHELLEPHDDITYIHTTTTDQQNYDFFGVASFYNKKLNYQVN